MSTKTDRILSYLPATFSALPKPTALFSLADAFGGELQAADNSLAAVMMAHWADYADRDEELIADLAGIAALYGLAPRGAPEGRPLPAEEGTVNPPIPADETVEEFREHLKRYVRTFLQGTVTVQGILRIAAEALGLHIADDYTDLDTWWTRDGDALLTTTPRGDDAAQLLFGSASITVTGRSAEPALVVGPELGDTVDFTGAPALRLKVGGSAPVEVNLPAHASLDEIVTAINNALGADVARRLGSRLALISPKTGPTSRLEVQDVADDAAPLLLGLPAHTYQGSAETAAQVSGTVDLAGPVDMSGSHPRYLRLRIDGALTAEIDCADPGNPAATTLDTIRDRINTQLGAQIASHDGHYLTLVSPTTGSQSSISLEVPAAQDAAEALFGPVSRFCLGHGPLPAQMTGGRDLGRGVDLRARSKVRLQVDNHPAVTVDCAGQEPAHTRPSEIAAALNTALGPGVASQDGHFVSLTSLQAGPGALLAFRPVAGVDDATDLIFGIGSRAFQGTAAEPATIVGTPDLSQGANLWASHVVQVAVDGGQPVEVDVRAQAADPGVACLDEMAGAFEALLGAGTAPHDGQHLILRSPTVGGDSSLTIQPLTTSRGQRFVTRALITDEAAQVILGFVSRQAAGTAAEPAQVTGTPDLSQGVDLRQARFLRFSLDGQPACQVDLAASAAIPRPRVALPDEIVKAINDVFDPAGTGGVALHDGHHLTLASTQTGGRIAFEPPRGSDALSTLLGLEPGAFRGKAATGVHFQSLVDLSDGINLPANAAIALGLDGSPPVDVQLTAGQPAHISLVDLAVRINVALGLVVARPEGAYLGITSRMVGAGSGLEFGVPTVGVDVTAQLTGIKPPRRYQGAAATAAQVIGMSELPAEVDLSVARTLRLVVDTVQSDVDCAAGQADPAHVPLGQIVAAINAVVGPGVADQQGQRLVLTSPTTGDASRIALLAYAGGDARTVLLGTVPDVTTAGEPAPAVITGETALLAPVNLNERRLLRLAVDGGHPVDLDVSGPAPESTTLQEIVEAINAVMPGLAAATDDDKLTLTSPTAGESSRLELLPLRVLELIEYPQEPAADPAEAEQARQVCHGESWTVLNDGAAAAELAIEICAPHGVAGPELANRTAGWRIRLMTLVRPGETARIWPDPAGGPRAEIEAADGTRRSIPASEILVRPLTPNAADEQDLIPFQADALILPQGRSEWLYLDCASARFDRVRFGQARFAGEVCREEGVFDVSRFIQEPPGSEVSVFATPIVDQPVEIRFRWPRYRPGALVVNLPLDLPERFGARLNSARFGKAGDTPEEYLDVVTESRQGTKPEDDPDHLVGRLRANPSTLVEAEVAALVPIGWGPAEIPFRGPRVRKLVGGTDTQAAALYLHDPDVPGSYIELRANRPGAWGNDIAVTVRKSGPATFDVTIGYAGARLESARQIVLTGRILKPGEEPLPALAQDLFKPGPVGVLHAKAAGVTAGVTRE